MQSLNRFISLMSTPSFQRLSSSDYDVGHYPLRDEPSVQHLGHVDGPIQNRPPLSQTPEEDTLVQMNAIYSSINDEVSSEVEKIKIGDESDAPKETVPRKYDTAKLEPNPSLPPRKSLSEDRKRVLGGSPQFRNCNSKPPLRQSSSITERYGMQELADHFLYQVPSSLTNEANATVSDEPNETYVSMEGEVKEEGVAAGKVEEEIYLVPNNNGSIDVDEAVVWIYYFMKFLM